VLCMVSMHRRASSLRRKVMYALPVGLFLALAAPYGPARLTEICGRRPLRQPPAACAGPSGRARRQRSSGAGRRAFTTLPNWPKCSADCSTSS